MEGQKKIGKEREDKNRHLLHSMYGDDQENKRIRDREKAHNDEVKEQILLISQKERRRQKEEEEESVCHMP